MNSIEEAQRVESWGIGALSEVRDAKRNHQNAVAQRTGSWIKSNRYFYDRLKSLLRFIVPLGKRVLGVRCETVDLLASVEPSRGVGIEMGDALVAQASK